MVSQMRRCDQAPVFDVACRAQVRPKSGWSAITPIVPSRLVDQSSRNRNSLIFFASGSPVLRAWAS
jgi:hypothetical protein